MDRLTSEYNSIRGLIDRLYLQNGTNGTNGMNEMNIVLGQIITRLKRMVNLNILENNRQYLSTYVPYTKGGLNASGEYILAKKLLTELYLDCQNKSIDVFHAELSVCHIVGHLKNIISIYQNIPDTDHCYEEIINFRNSIVS